MPPGHGQLGGNLWGKPNTHLAWERLRNPQEELWSAARERDIMNTLLNLLPPQPTPRQQEDNRCINKVYTCAAEINIWLKNLLYDKSIIIQHIYLDSCQTTWVIIIVFHANIPKRGSWPSFHPPPPLCSSTRFPPTLSWWSVQPLGAP